MRLNANLPNETVTDCERIAAAMRDLDGLTRRRSIESANNVIDARPRFGFGFDLARTIPIDLSGNDCA